MNQLTALSLLRTESVEFDRLYREWKTYVSHLHEAVPRVVVCGLLKAGKSSLLNALTNHLQDEYFATGAVRTTTLIKEIVFENVRYVDTPGLDANQVDEDEAWRGMVNVDQIVFVHNMRVGEFDLQELEFLQQLANSHPQIAQQMVLVMSNVESAQNELAHRVANFEQTLTKVLKFCPTILLTSWPNYRKGMLENKTRLVTQSGIPQLQQVMQTQLLTQKQTLSAARQAREQQYRQQMNLHVAQAIEHRRNQIHSLQRTQQGNERVLSEDFGELLRALRQGLENYRQI